MKQTHCSVPKAAELLGCSKTWVLKLLRNGKIKGFKINEKAWCVEIKGLKDNVKKYLKRVRDGGKGRPRSKTC